MGKTGRSGGILSTPVSDTYKEAFMRALAARAL
jgi:hypothetical protein